MPTTTRLTPAAAMASAQGGVRPWWAQGSRVTYMVAPRALEPAASRATASAWGPPGGWVAPPICSPPHSRMAPTQGLGEVEVRTAAASSMARRIPASSDTLAPLPLTRARDSKAAAPSLPSGLSPSAPGFHRVGPRPEPGVRGLSPPVGTFTQPREGHGFGSLDHSVYLSTRLRPIPRDDYPR